jgi:glutamyl-tRNA synthetase
MPQLRVRFAPSPTGFLHVGGARTALYNWLYARRHGGAFILRIEDTDADRSKPELEKAIIESLKWLGLDWDEGPFRQSERFDRYRVLAAELEALGAAYPCFCTPESLQEKRTRAEAERRPTKYDGTCRDLDPAEHERMRRQGRPAALRFRVPDAGSTGFEDQVFGKIELQNREIEDFILVRADGQPTYHLGVVADDLDMGVTEVIRGADHISNTPKQLLIYRAVHAEAPSFAHLPLILGPDKQRLSKRHGATSVGAYRETGMLPEALINFLALLGWTPPPAEGGAPREILTLNEMVSAFSLDAVSKSNAVFDLDKLGWMNSEYLRKLPPDRLWPRVEAELREAQVLEPGPVADEARLQACARLLQPRARTLKDFSTWGRAFFSDEFKFDSDAMKKFWKDASVADLLGDLGERIACVEPFNLDEAERTLRALAHEKGVKAGLLINAARVALTGQGVAPGLFEVMVVLGRGRTAERLRRAAVYLKELTAHEGTAIT